MQRLGRAAKGPGRVYLAGGSTAVLFAFRDQTIDIDIKLDPEPEGVFEAIALIKEEMELNVELAAPDQFVPALPGWQDRSLFIEKVGDVEFYHYDLYGQVLAKLERGHETDVADVRDLIQTGRVEAARLGQLFAQVEAELVRFPAVDPKRLAASVKKIVEES